MWAKIDQFLMSADPLKIFWKSFGVQEKNSVVSKIVLYHTTIYRGSSVLWYMYYKCTTFLSTMLPAFNKFTVWCLWLTAEEEWVWVCSLSINIPILWKRFDLSGPLRWSTLTTLIGWDSCNIELSKLWRQWTDSSLFAQPARSSEVCSTGTKYFLSCKKTTFIEANRIGFKVNQGPCLELATN